MKTVRQVYLLVFLSAVLMACGGGSGSGRSNQKPHAQFSNSISSDNTPLTINFDASSSSDSDGQIVRYQWDFGDGNSDSTSASTTSHAYSAAGLYSVTLTVIDNKNASSSLTFSVEVKTRLIAAISLSLAADGAIQFDGSDSSIIGASNNQPSITLYNWDFGDSNEAQGVVVTHRYEEPGPYQATLTITDSENNTASKTIPTTFSVSGTVFAASNTQVDVDVNDPARQSLSNSPTTFETNNTANNAQALNNPIFLNGYVSAIGSSSVGIDNGNFSDNSDRYDYYYVTLLKGQFVSIRIADFDSNNPTKNNIDLSLLDTDFNVIRLSASTNKEFESVFANQDGEYYIEIEAVSGVSKYVMSIGGNTFTSGADAYGASLNFVPGEAIVKLNNRTASSSTSAAQTTSQLVLSHNVSSRPGLLQFDLSNPKSKLAVSTTNALSVTAVNKEKIATLNYIKTLNLRPDVEYAEPNYRTSAYRVPNDSYYPLQKHYPQINLPQAWEISTGNSTNEDITVAVIDTGLVLTHEDLIGKSVDGYDFVRDPEASQDGDGIDNDPNDPGDGGNATTSSWHGTHVAGTIAAASNNTIGVSGVSWGAKLMPVRALGKGGGTSYDLEQSIRFAAGLRNDSGTVPVKAADIINLSLGGAGYSQATQNLFQLVHDRGIVVVAAAGNDNSANPSYPAAYDHVISVSAVDLSDAPTQYSNFGESIDIAAPGGDLSTDRDGDGYGDGILSSFIDDSDGFLRNGYSFLQGTSMATPHIAGVVALMKAVYPDLTATDFESAMQNGLITKTDNGTEKDNFLGYGIVDALKAVQHAELLSSGTVTGSVISTVSHLDFGSLINSRTITLKQSGNNAPNITNVATTASWLTIDSSNTNENGLGSYTVTVDRTGLSDAIFSDTIIFTLDNDSVLNVSVSMQVKTTSSEISDAGYLYLLILDANSFESLAQINIDIENGEYRYSFQNIPYGEYFIIGGSDIDNDSFICGIGETCGSYPTNDLLQRITISENVSQLDFLASIVSGLITSSQTTPNNTINKLNRKEALQRLINDSSTPGEKSVIK